MKLHEVENLRRSVAMAAPEGPSGLTREQALAVLAQLQEDTAQRDRLVDELRALGLA